MGSTPHHVGSGQKVPKSTKQNTTQEYPQNAETLPTTLVGSFRGYLLPIKGFHVVGIFVCLVGTTPLLVGTLTPTIGPQ